MTDEIDSQSWHLDKKVPIVLICAILAQVVTFAWWASAQNSLTLAHEKRLDQAERRIEIQDTGTRTLSEKVVRIEANTDNIVNSIRRIESAVRPDTDRR